MVVLVGYFHNLARKNEMKNINDLGLFDNHFLTEKLTKLNDPLQKLNGFIPV